jgi:hypothetical protein
MACSAGDSNMMTELVFSTWSHAACSNRENGGSFLSSTLPTSSPPNRSNLLSDECDRTSSTVLRTSALGSKAERSDLACSTKVHIALKSRLLAK